MKNINKVLLILSCLFLAAIAAVFAGSVSAAPDNSPLFQATATPTPTPAPQYWTGEPGTFTYTHGSGTCIQNWSGSSPYVAEIDSWGGGCQEIFAPGGSSQNNIAGVIWTLDAKNLGGCDVRLQHGTNTNWMKKFQDAWSPIVHMSVGETACVGTAGACASAGLSVAVETDWEGTRLNGGYYTLNSVHNNADFCWGGATWTATMEPIFYGIPIGCEDLGPDDRIAESTGLLLGQDDIGEVFQLEPDGEYMLYTSDGPWNDGTDDRYDVAVRFKTSHAQDPPAGAWQDWHVLDFYSGEDLCDTGFLDANGAELTFINNDEFFEGEGPYSEIQFRVNDTDPDFGDNSGDVAYYWLGGEGFGQSCRYNWNKETLVGSITINPNDDNWFNKKFLGGTERIVNGLYALTVTGSIEDGDVIHNDIIVANSGLTTYSGWRDYLDYNLWTGLNTCDYETETLSEFYGNSRITFYEDEYTLNFGFSHPHAIIDDKDANLGNNSGTLTADIHTAGYTAPISDCGSKYTIGTFIESPVVDARAENGISYPQAVTGLTIGQTYYLSQEGTPYQLNGSDSYDFLVKWPGLLDPWEDPEDWADCVTDLTDETRGFYFTAAAESFKIRALSSGFPASHDNNSGTLKFNLHGSIDDTVPPGEDCADYWDIGRVIWRGDIDADYTPGEAIDYSVFEPGEEYIIAVAPLAYTDPDGTGKTGEIRRAAPGTGSVSYEDMATWPGALCYHQINGYDHVYIKAAELSDYEVRATDPGGGNSGTFKYIVYEADRVKDTVLGCELEDYNVDSWTLVKIDEIINANNNGMSPPMVLANAFNDDNGDGARYKIETGYIDGQVTGPPVWDLEISDNGGSSWVFLQDWADCYVDLGTPEGRFYFTEPVDGGPFFLRVHDVLGLYAPNVGGVEYDLYIEAGFSQDEDDVYDDWEDIYDYDNWAAGCLLNCNRPGWLELGKMVDYVRCRFQQFISWCPRHARKIQEMQDLFYDTEPIGTIMDFVGLGRAIQAEMQGYDWGYVEGGGADSLEDWTVQTPINYIIEPGEGGGGDIPLVNVEGSIWGGGEIDLAGGLGGASFSTTCDLLLSDYVGSGMSQSMCFAANVMNVLGLSTWVQFIWDMGMVIALWFYLANRWIQPNT
jgi:hypothetical protein